MTSHPKDSFSRFLAALSRLLHNNSRQQNKLASWALVCDRMSPGSVLRQAGRDRGSGLRHALFWCGGRVEHLIARQQ